MLSRSQRISSALTGFSLIAVIALSQAVGAAQAQTTVLSGKVHSDAMPQLVRQVPQLDRMQVQTPVTIVNTQRSPYLAGAVQTKTVVQRPVYREVYVRDNRTYFQRHPKVKAVTIGAGVGAGAGALTGLVSGAGVVRGAAIGAGSGAGVGLVRSSTTLKRHPIIRDTATGTIAGLGLGAASSRRGKRAWQGAGVGAAVGLGVGLFKNLK